MDLHLDPMVATMSEYRAELDGKAAKMDEFGWSRTAQDEGSKGCCC